MKYVLDSSVAVKWILTEVDSDKALNLRDDARAAIHELLSPDIFPIECGHALTRAERQLRISHRKVGWRGGRSWPTVLFSILPFRSCLCFRDLLENARLVFMTASTSLWPSSKQASS